MVALAPLLHVLVKRDRNGNPVTEVHVLLEHEPSLPVAADDHHKLAPEVLHCLGGGREEILREQPGGRGGEVADAGPDQLGGAGGRFRGEVAALDARDGEAAGSGVEGGAGASRAAADY